MNFIIGNIIVFAAVLGGYMALGGKLKLLYQPFELVIIGGSGIGAFVISNTGPTLKKVGKAMGRLFKGEAHNKAHFVDLLVMLSALFKMARGAGGTQAVEKNVENPHESAFFQNYPTFLKDHHAVDFVSDYMRLLVIASYPAHVIEDLMEKDIEAHHHDGDKVVNAMANLGDAFPALGIVAAVLGVIKTMAAIAEPPEVLGGLIGAALVGTFLGVLLSYGLVGPMAKYLGQSFDNETAYLKCIKAGIIAHMQNYAPQIAIEFARKTLPGHCRPSFQELEEAVSASK